MFHKNEIMGKYRELQQVWYGVKHLADQPKDDSERLKANVKFMTLMLSLMPSVFRDLYDYVALLDQNRKVMDILSNHPLTVAGRTMAEGVMQLAEMSRYGLAGRIPEESPYLFEIIAQAIEEDRWFLRYTDTDNIIPIGQWLEGLSSHYGLRRHRKGKDINFCIKLYQSSLSMVVMKNVLPDGLTMDYLKLAGTNIIRLPNNLTMEDEDSTLDISNTKIKKLPRGLVANGTCYFRDTQFTSIPGDAVFGEDVYLDDSKITALPDDFTTGGHCDLSGSDCVQLGKNITIGGNFNACRTRIKELSENLTVNGKFSVPQHVTKLPSSLQAKNIYLWPWNENENRTVEIPPHLRNSVNVSQRYNLVQNDGTPRPVAFNFETDRWEYQDNKEAVEG